MATKKELQDKIEDLENKISHMEQDHYFNMRNKNLEIFKNSGFPSNRLEDWKFTDFRKIVDSNFIKLDAKKVTSDFKKTELLKNFDHNYII